MRRIRAGDAHGHRRSMRVAALLVGLFLISYLVKVAVLGREERSTWTDTSRWLLYVHEAFIAAMIVAAGAAFARARRFGRLADGDDPAPDAREPDRRFHRIAGRVAVVAGALALLLAATVLLGMYGRAAL